MIHVLAAIRVKPEHKAEFIKIFNANVPNVRAEQGCIEYIPTIDTDSGIDLQQRDDNVVTIIEKWETLKDLHVHLAAPHMQQYKNDTADMVEGMTLSILENA